MSFNWNCSVCSFSKGNETYLSTSFVVLINGFRKHNGNKIVMSNSLVKCRSFEMLVGPFKVLSRVQESTTSCSSTLGRRHRCSE